MNKDRLKTMVRIAKRAKENGLLMFDVMSLVMDLKLADEAFGLNIDELEKADDQNFAHDITGIQNNIDRKNKKFEETYLPRYA